MQFMSASSTFAADPGTNVGLILHVSPVDKPQDILSVPSQLPQTQADWKNLFLACFLWFQMKVYRSCLDAYT